MAITEAQRRAELLARIRALENGSPTTADAARVWDEVRRYIEDHTPDPLILALAQKVAAFLHEEALKEARHKPN